MERSSCKLKKALIFQVETLKSQAKNFLSF